MRWGLQKIQELYPDAFDAVCVFDADNLAEENFLAEMNKALCSGAEVATGYLEPKNPQDSWTSGCYALYWLMMMRFYHEARNNCGPVEHHYRYRLRLQAVRAGGRRVEYSHHYRRLRIYDPAGMRRPPYRGGA